MREPDWLEDEFVTLLRNLDKSDEELSGLTGRSVGAIGTVKAGLREYAKGKKSTTLLSDYMRDLLRGREQYLSALGEP
jgi:hypothetical protein